MKEEKQQRVQKLSNEDLLAKEMQLDSFERDLERAELELKQITKRIENGFFERQAEFLKMDLLRKAKSEVDRVQHNLVAVKEQIKSKEVSI